MVVLRKGDPQRISLFPHLKSLSFRMKKSWLLKPEKKEREGGRNETQARLRITIDR